MKENNILEPELPIEIEPEEPNIPDFIICEICRKELEIGEEHEFPKGDDEEPIEYERE